MSVRYAIPVKRWYYVCPLKKCGRSYHFAYYPTQEEAEAAEKEHVAICSRTATPNIFKR